MKCLDKLTELLVSSNNNLHLWQIIEAMQAVLLAEVQRTMTTLRKTAVCREPLATVENGNGKLQTWPKTEKANQMNLQYVKNFVT